MQMFDVVHCQQNWKLEAMTRVLGCEPRKENMTEIVHRTLGALQGFMRVQKKSEVEALAPFLLYLQTTAEKQT